MRIERMGERGALATELETEPWRFADLRHPLLEEVVPSREAVGLHFNRWPGLGEVETLLRSFASSAPAQPRSHEVAVTFDGPDLASSAEALGITPERLIEAFLAHELTVFCLGFQPGFAYMGTLAPQICGLPRLSQPRPRVPAGSVGIAEDQAGIYPCESPGGWNLIGSTVESMADLEHGWFRFQAGDRVQFREAA